MPDAAPRYLQIAAEYRLAIKNGSYGLGDLLPTEHEMCARHEISRHTARSALQLLEEDGLIERRRGAGTKVVSTGTPPAFEQPLGGLDELLQYARETHLVIHHTRSISTLNSTLKSFGATGAPWFQLDGIRQVDGIPAVVSTIFVRDRFSDQPSDYTELPHAIIEELRIRHGILIGSIAQHIEADALSKRDAQSLARKEGIPILKTTRRYFDETGRLFVVSVNRHPGDSFSYSMTYKKAR